MINIDALTHRKPRSNALLYELAPPLHATFDHTSSSSARWYEPLRFDDQGGEGSFAHDASSSSLPLESRVEPTTTRFTKEPPVFPSHHLSNSLRLLHQPMRRPHGRSGYRNSSGR